MSSPPELPSMFGRFTAILQDHDHLGTTLRQLRAMCSALEVEQALPSELAPELLLGKLRADLAAHFTAEESVDYFGVVVAEEPNLESQIGALKSEHAAMLYAAETLWQLAGDRGRLLLLAVSTRELVAEVERHERSESRLLRTLFFPTR